MPLPLREPFFLKGRTSVVQHAVIMTLVLGGLAAVASWIFAGWPLLPGSRRRLGALLWGVALGGVIYGPLNYWNGRSIWHTVAPVGLATTLQLGFQSSLFSERWPRTVSELLRNMLPHLAIACGSGLLQFRLTRLHLIAYLVTILWAAIPVDRSYRYELSDWLSSSGVPFLGRQIIMYSVYGFHTITPLAIPWGIPFWWPPEKDAAAKA